MIPSSPGPGLAKVPNFDPLANSYRWLEYFSFGPFLQRTRCHFLPQLPRVQRALVLGDGDGRFTARLFQSQSDIAITAVDASPAMLNLLQLAACAAVPNPRLCTICTDIRNWLPTASYDLVSTHFFLDCLTTPEVATLASRLAHFAAPNALWIVSDFAIPANRFGRLLAAPVVAILYRTFRILTGLRPQSLPDHRTALAAAGWTLQAQHPHLNGCLVSELWRLNSPAPTAADTPAALPPPPIPPPVSRTERL